MDSSYQKMNRQWIKEAFKRNTWKLKIGIFQPSGGVLVNQKSMNVCKHTVKVMPLLQLMKVLAESFFIFSLGSLC